MKSTTSQGHKRENDTKKQKEYKKFRVWNLGNKKIKVNIHREKSNTKDLHWIFIYKLCINSIHFKQGWVHRPYFNSYEYVTQYENELKNAIKEILYI